MGTDDQTTYLMIGQETGGKSLTSVMDAADKRLHDVMDNFRPLDEKRVTISGVTAIERRFRGSVDDHDWSGVAVYIPRGAERVHNLRHDAGQHGPGANSGKRNFPRHHQPAIHEVRIGLSNFLRFTSQLRTSSLR